MRRTRSPSMERLANASEAAQSRLTKAARTTDHSRTSSSNNDTKQTRGGAADVEALRRSRSDGSMLIPRRLEHAQQRLLASPSRKEAEDVAWSASQLESLWQRWEERCAKFELERSARIKSDLAHTSALAALSAPLLTVDALQTQRHNAGMLSRAVTLVHDWSQRYALVEAYTEGRVLALVSSSGRILELALHVRPSLDPLHSSSPGLLSDDVFESWYASGALATRALTANPSLRSALRFLPNATVRTARATDEGASDPGLTLLELAVLLRSHSPLVCCADTRPYGLTLSATQRLTLSAHSSLGGLTHSHAPNAPTTSASCAPSAVVLPHFAALLRAQLESKAVSHVAYTARVKRLVAQAGPFLHALSELGTSPEALGVRALLLANVLQ